MVTEIYPTLPPICCHFDVFKNEICLFSFLINIRRLQAVICCVKLYYSLTLLWYFRQSKVKKLFSPPAEFFSADQKWTHFWLGLAHSNPLESGNYKVWHCMLQLGASCYCLKKNIVNFSLVIIIIGHDVTSAALPRPQWLSNLQYFRLYIWNLHHPFGTRANFYVDAVKFEKKLLFCTK